MQAFTAYIHHSVAIKPLNIALESHIIACHLINIRHSIAQHTTEYQPCFSGYFYKKKLKVEIAY